MAEEGFCPECGRAVSASVASGLADPADPDWLGELILGSYVATIGPIAGFFGMAVLGGLGLVLEHGSGNIWKYVLMTGYWLGAIGLLAIPIGMWLIAAPDPCLSHRRRCIDAAVALRFGLLALIPGTILSFSSLAWSTPSFLSKALFVTLSPIGVAGLIVMILFARRMSRLSVRVGEPKIINRNRLLSRWCLFAWSAGLIGFTSGHYAVAFVALFIAIPIVMITGSLILVTPLLLVEQMKIRAAEMRRVCGKRN